jgi:HAE1 family hydrophobic/amphiphilic exporter-1
VFTALFILAASTFLFNKYVTKGRIWGAWGGREYLSVYLTMPKGSEIQRTDEIIRRFEMKAVGDPNVQKVSTNVYNERATMRIDFSRLVRRTAYPYLLKEKLINEASLIAGLYVGVYGFGDSFSSGGFGRSGGGQRIKVLGYNYRRVGEIAEDLGRRLERNARVRDVNTNASNWWYGGDVFEVILRIDRERLGRFGMTPSDLLYMLQSHLTEKLSSSRVKLDSRLIENSIKFQGFSTFSMEDLKNLLIQTPSGETVRLREVSVIEKQPTMPSIIRENQQYKRLVQYEYRGPWKMADRLKENIIKTTHLPPGYKVESDTYDFMSEEETSQIYFILAISLFLIFLVTAGLFESLIHPFLILFTVPLSLSGVFLIFFLTGTNIDRSAYIGVILLGGIVVNDSILLVDHINLLRRKGASIREAVIRGASERMRPILMTTFTTIGGLLPLVFLSKDSGDIWYSLALATIGGLMASTVLALTVIPAMYMTFEKIACSVRNGLQLPSRQTDIHPEGRRARNPA